MTSANGPFELLERDIPEPAARQVRIKIQACGVCHSDSFTKTGAYPGIQYPRIPGHEVVGIVDALGADVPDWQPGQRVGVGWHGGHCGHCRSCRHGDFITCENGQIPGISYDGGYAEYMIAPFEALASVPDELGAAEAAPLLCAGITAFNALRNSGARAGELVAVLGVGGLGHLAVQFAAKMGCHAVAIARGWDKEALARKLGAHDCIDSVTQDVAAELTRLGGPCRPGDRDQRQGDERHDRRPDGRRKADRDRRFARTDRGARRGQRRDDAGCGQPSSWLGPRHGRYSPRCRQRPSRHKRQLHH
ncbi:MAG: alcohol dehydrogenase catalytic domain-containing protein [Aliidongia sp.]